MCVCMLRSMHVMCVTLPFIFPAREKHIYKCGSSDGCALEAFYKFLRIVQHIDNTGSNRKTWKFGVCRRKTMLDSSSSF